MDIWKFQLGLIFQLQLYLHIGNLLFTHFTSQLLG